MFQGCYPTRCTPRAGDPDYQSFEADGGFTLEIMDPNGAWHKCTPSKEISVPGFVGSITCPDAWGSFCAPPSYESMRRTLSVADMLTEVVQLRVSFKASLGYPQGCCQ